MTGVGAPPLPAPFTRGLGFQPAVAAGSAHRPVRPHHRHGRLPAAPRAHRPATGACFTPRFTPARTFTPAEPATTGAHHLRAVAAPAPHPAIGQPSCRRARLA